MRNPISLEACSTPHTFGALTARLKAAIEAEASS